MEKIKNLFTFIILSIISLSCNSETNKLDLTINIENDTIHAYSDTLGSKTMNIIKYSITNNSNELYYINSINSLVAIKGLNSNGKIIRVFNENNSEVKYISLVHDYNKKFDFDCYECNMKMSEKFMEKYYNLTKDFDDNSNFYYKYNGLAFINFIPAKSTIHFEYLINLSNFTIYDESRYGFVNLDKNKNHYATFMIQSDSLNYRTALPRYHLKNIEQNNAKVFHGILKADKKIVVKVIE